MKLLKTFFSTLAIAGSLAAFGADNKPSISSTIDFLDYVFYDVKDGNKEYYPLEVYEQRIREMAEGGLDKIYLRVNVCGLTLYPTKFSAIYGANGAWHWNVPAESKRLINTLAKYDPLAETIRLGHKYGLEVWCWESLFDEGAGTMNDPTEEFIAAGGGDDCRPLLDPYYRKVPQCQAMRNPALVADQKKIVEINAAARKYPLAKIVLTDVEKMNVPVKITADEVMIYTSPDNRNYTRYEKPFKFSSGRNEAGFNYVVIDGLSITDPYVKLVHPVYKDDRWSIAVRRARGQGVIYNTRGEKVNSVWSTVFAPEAKPETPLDFANFASAGWDYKHYQAGFIIGEPEEQSAYYLGIAEFNQPEAMEHRLNKFSELVKYDFDGFMFNVRTHSAIADPENYGYNPAVIEKFRARFGREPGVSDSDRAAVFQIRAEGIADFFKNCKAMTNGRPIYLSGLENAASGKPANTSYQKKLGPLPWLYERYFDDKSIDGVIMIGTDFRDQLLPIIGDRDVKLGVFREMGFPPRGYDFAKDISTLKKDPQLDEVELYETMVLSFNPSLYREILKPVE